MLYLLRRGPELLGVALALLVGVVAHSVVQSAVARAVGDRTPQANGRLSLDPKRHFEPFGVIVMLISGVGWNKPVPLQEPRFRGARNRYLIAVLAGPLTNLALAALGLVALRLVGTDLLASANPRGFLDTFTATSFGEKLLFEFTVVNAALGVLTLLPIPPLDGARILWLFAPKTGPWRNARYHLEERNIGLAICVVLFLPLFGGIGLLMSLVVAISEAYLAPIAHALGLAVGF